MRIRIQEVKKPVENALNKCQKHKVDYKKCIFKFKIYIIKSNSTLKTVKKYFLSRLTLYFNLVSTFRQLFTSRIRISLATKADPHNAKILV